MKSRVVTLIKKEISYQFVKFDRVEEVSVTTVNNILGSLDSVNVYCPLRGLGLKSSFKGKCFNLW